MTPADHAADRQRGAWRRCRTAWSSDTHHLQPERDQRRARSPTTGSARTRRSTSGLQNADYGINVPHNVASAQGLANIVVTGFFSLGDAQQPFVERVNEVLQFADDFTWMRGTHSLKFGVDIRSEHMLIAFVNRPNGDFTFTGDTSQRTGNAAADFLLGLPAQFRRTTANTVQDGTAGSTRGYVQDEFRPRSQPDGERRPALRAAAAVRRRERRAQLVPARPAVDAVPAGAGRPRLSRRRGRAARHLRDRQEQLRAARRRRLGSDRQRPHRACAARGASSTTRSPGRATSSRTACSRRRSRRCSR